MERNKAQKIRVFVFDPATNLPAPGLTLGDFTCEVSKNNATPVAITDQSPTEAQDGYYLFDLTADETNADYVATYPAYPDHVCIVDGPMSTINNVTHINDQQITSGLVRINIIDNSYLRKGVLYLVEGDTYSEAAGTEIAFESPLFPNLFDSGIEKITLSIWDTSNDVLALGPIEGSVTEIDRVFFEYDDLPVDPTSETQEYEYDLKIHYTGNGHITKFRDVCDIKPSYLEIGS